MRSTQRWLLCVIAGSALSCSAADDDPSYYAVRAVLTTGNEGSDGTVNLCWTATGEQTCKELSSGNDDFEPHEKQTFDLQLSPRVAHGTPFTSFQLKYTTGLSLGDTWEPTGLRLARYYGRSQEELICDSTFDQTLSNGGALTPPGCP